MHDKQVFPHHSLVFFCGPGMTNSWWLDQLFGLLIVVVLLNVVIAVVSDAWEDSQKQARTSFWKYRVSFLVDNGSMARNAFFFPKMCGMIDSLGLIIWYNPLEDLELVTSWTRGVVFFMVLVVWASCHIALTLAGLVTMGFLWPKQYREYVVGFTGEKDVCIEDELETVRDELSTLKEELEDKETKLDAKLDELKSLIVAISEVKVE